MIIIKILEPIGRDEKIWMQEFQKEGVLIEYQDTRSWQDTKLIEYVKDAQVLVLANRPLSRRVIDSAMSLRLIAIAFTGIDHVDQVACRERSIEVKNAPGYATHAVAELTIALAIALCRNLILASQSLTQKGLFPLGGQLYGKKVGIIGAGSIGQEVGRLFSAFGSEVVFFHYRNLETKNLKQVGLDDLLKQCDFISLHLPLNEKTKHLLNREKLSLLKRSAFLINTGRGSLVEESALFDLLKEGKIAGAALDVLEQEPPLKEAHPFLKMPNVILTPHVGYRTQEAAFYKANLVIGHIRNWIGLGQKTNE